MAMMAPKSGSASKGDFKIPPAGPHVATLYAVLDIGTHFRESPKYGDSYKRQIMFRWELPDELIEVEYEGVKEMRPMVVSKTFTFSMHENSNLRPFIGGLLARSLTDAEAATFDFEALAGTPCQINISHYTKRDGNTGADVVSMSPLGKRTTAPEQVNDTLVYSVNEGPPPEEFAGWLKEKILASQELKGSGQQQPERAKPVGSNGENFVEPGIDDEPEDKFPWEEDANNVAPPNSGKALYGWAQEVEKKGASGLMNEIVANGKRHGFPNRIVDWETHQVHQAHAEALDWLHAAKEG